MSILIYYSFLPVYLQNINQNNKIMIRQLFLSIMLLGFTSAISAQTNNTTKNESRTLILLQKKKEDISKRPQKPAYSPVYCIVTNEDITVVCEYDTTGDVLVVDSRTGMTVANVTAANLGEGYSINISESDTDTPLIVYVTISGTTYWAEI